MEVIDIFVEFASGITITDRAMFVPDLREVCVSERLAAVIREFAMTEAPPRITATIAGHTIALDQGASGNFFAPEGSEHPAGKSAWWLRLLQALVPQTKDQRQQFGRLMHTLSAASLIGAIGFWHSTSVWTAGNILSEVNLVLAFVITYYEGMVSMKGE
ncbi:hypothetical protein [Paraburkholderia gardini]|uniref:hypothetical protein n=1 Tax=Paraburkholderia gardini TaxID=2823469 RepID=UPI001D903A04|nr:hypothetical protein [Paraburkholderia gardini]CAG4913756.1 hypothetical protein R69919_04126 [Paraburkholderia gardini]